MADKANEVKENENRKPAVYYCRHMEGGVAKYSDEMILFEIDDIKKMMPSFVGCPVYVGHQDVDYDKMKAEAVGYISDCFYNELDGWVWAKFVINDEKGHEVIQQGHSVSNAYLPTEWTYGGTHHNVEYNRKLTNGTFNHLALVPDPRYEEAKIFTPEGYKAYQEKKRAELKELQNNKEKGVTKMLKFFKNERKEVSQIDEDSLLEIDGKEVSVKQMVNALLSNKKNEDDAKKNDGADMEKEVEVGDEKMPLKELINRYKKMSSKKNEDEDEDEDEDKKDKENADEDGEGDDFKKDAKKSSKKNADEEEREGEDEDKKNRKAKKNEVFNSLRNAEKNANADGGEKIALSLDMLQRGRDRY